MNKSKVFINKRLKGLSRDELDKLSKAELIDKIIQMNAYNFQLKNILQKKLDAETEMPGLDKSKSENVDNLIAGVIDDKGNEEIDNSHESYNEKNKRKFDFSRSHNRHVLLRLLYFGWDYQGFACQEDSNATIEYHLFRALIRACLIESRASSNYHRCGRTDKEVSAFCQVVSIDLRSKFPEDLQLNAESVHNEIDYCGLLNRILPKNIQCIAWMPLKTTLYSARFDCQARTYRYYFPCGDLDIEAMRVACTFLERHTDFRNFCKMDVHNGVTNYVRNLQAAKVHLCPDEHEDGRGYSMYYLEIKANAFLWHQIRCIMAVLLLIGQGKEKPTVIKDLLDIETNPCKPQYTPALGLPLNLFSCEFRRCSTRKLLKNSVTKQDSIADELKNGNEFNVDVDDTSNESDTNEWVFNEENLQKLITTVQSEWTRANVKSTMIRNVLYNLEGILNTEFKAQHIKDQVLLLQDSIKPRHYQQLLQRKRCESLENRIQHFVKKQRLVMKTTEEINNG